MSAPRRAVTALREKDFRHERHDMDIDFRLFSQSVLTLIALVDLCLSCSSVGDFWCIGLLTYSVIS